MNYQPAFRVSRIVYFTNLTRDAARVIPLGSLAEVITPHVHGLALKARTALATDELALVTPLLRDRIKNPFTFLRGEFDLAWEGAEPGKVIEFLAGRHSTSL